MKKLELVKAFKMEQENESLKAYKRMFPNAQPNIYQMELIEAYATDLAAWQSTLEFWCSNDYRPQSIGKMLDYYRQVKAGTVQTFESKEKVGMKVGKPTLVEQTWTCGICFDTGEKCVPDETQLSKIRFIPCDCRKAA